MEPIISRKDFKRVKEEIKKIIRGKFKDWETGNRDFAYFHTYYTYELEIKYDNFDLMREDMQKVKEILQTNGLLKSPDEQYPHIFWFSSNFNYFYKVGDIIPINWTLEFKAKIELCEV